MRLHVSKFEYVVRTHCFDIQVHIVYCEAEVSFVATFKI